MELKNMQSAEYQSSQNSENQHNLALTLSEYEEIAHRLEDS